MAESATDAPAEADEGVEVSEAQLPQAAPGAPGPGQGQIDILLDSSVQVSATLGRTKMLIRDLLQAGKGSIITFDRKVGEPVDLYLSGVHFATGQMVVVGDHLGVRIKEILAPLPVEEGT